jgi:hypothetical protein
MSATILLEPGLEIGCALPGCRQWHVVFTNETSPFEKLSSGAARFLWIRCGDRLALAGSWGTESRQETAQVRAPHGLLVTADEFRDLEGRHQPVRQPAAHVRRVGSASRDFCGMSRFCVCRLPHRYLRAFAALNTFVQRLILG